MGRQLKKKKGFFAVYETVSEREDAVTPHFKTKEEVAEYLHKFGDYWMQKDKSPPLPKEIAEKFVKVGWVPSMVFQNGKFLSTYYCVEEMG